MEKTIECVAKDRCTGCGACFNKCPAGAISMKYDSEGFLFPYVDKKKCIECGLCQQVCPEMNMEKVRQRIHEEGKCYAAMAEDDIRMVSSSGGIFTLIADYIYEQNGIVCGAVYSEDYQEVYHIVSENSVDLERLRGSKYVQSNIGNTYSVIEKTLKGGRMVLFVGCPCQVSGLYSFLGKQYDNLYTIDIVCHGANSTLAYRSFVKEIAKDRKVTKVNFRDKSVFGWSTPVTINFSDQSVYNAAWNQNKWNDAFYEGIINRECCSSCHYAQRKRIGDITLGDFWQVQKWDESCNDGKGTSLVLVNNEQGDKIYSCIQAKLKLNKEAPLDFAVKYNGQLLSPNKKAEGRKYFFNHLERDGYHKAWWYGHKWRYDVGLVGWWFAANYGSVLTYYALARILEDMCLLPIMIRIPKMDGTGWESVTEKNIEFMQKYFPVSKPRKFEDMQECNQFCDAFMLGSDQLWVAFYNKMVGYTFFLDFADESKRKIAYATSIGRVKYEGDEEDKNIVKTLLKRFDAISVRESSGVEICKNEFDVDAVRMLDPVFLCDTKYYDLLAEQSKIQRDYPYILCYILDPTEEKRQAIRMLEEKYGMKSVVLLDMKSFDVCSKMWINENVIYNVGIEEFIYCIKNCSYMITDSHHGACFAMIYHKNFVAISNERRGKTRFESLFNLLNIKEILIEEKELLEKIMYIPEVDYVSIDKTLEIEKKKSEEWIRNALKQKDIKKKKIMEIELFSKYFNLAKRLGAKLNRVKGN
ncbi:MAG: polysaccharide pyruvyl transferase family protein [Lachnospiraceae bacterium]|nr:polysaccharide pyruvyl transferase family protein [Lachnospiraceae bacterium]